MSENQTPKETASKPRAKGTPKTEAIIGAASNKFTSATKALNDAVTTALELTKTVDENALKIAEQEDKLNGLNVEFSNKKNQLKVDLDLAFKADQKALVDKYLTDNKMVAVDAVEYSELENSVIEWEQKFEDKVTAEVGKAKGMAEAKAQSDARLVEAQYQAKEAQNLAKIQNLEAQLQFATTQAKQWETQLNAERQASVERAKAAQIGNLNVGTAGNGR